MWDVANSREESAIKTESTASEKEISKHALILYLLQFEGHGGAHSHSTTLFSFCFHGSGGQTNRTLELLPHELATNQYCLFQISKVLLHHFTVNWRLHMKIKDSLLTASVNASNDLIPPLSSSHEV